MYEAGERGALIFLDETPVAHMLELAVRDGRGDLLHGVQAEVAAVGEDRSEQRAYLVGLGLLLCRAQEVRAEPQVVLYLDEQVGQADGTAASIEPTAQFGEARRAFRVRWLGMVGFEPPAVVIEGDLVVIGDAVEETVEGVGQARLQLADRMIGFNRESGAGPEVVACPLPRRIGQEERPESTEVLRAVNREVAGADLVTHLEEQRALPTPTVDGAVAAHKRLQRLGHEADRCHR